MKSADGAAAHIIYDIGMLQTRLTPAALRDALPEAGTWRWWPSARDRVAWDRAVSPARRTWIVAQAESAIAAGLPALPASLFLDCARTGNRVRGETVIFARRSYLGYTTLAYAVTRDARWLDQALDALWALAEESTWCIPAHLGAVPQGQKAGLPRHDLPVVDLFAAETAAVVSDALDVLRDDLNELDDRIVPRLVHELRVRVVDPVTTETGWWWLSGRNNWTPWIMSNAGRTVLAHGRDRERTAEVVERLLGAADRFLANYGPDGGCDEGMRYWGVAFGTLFIYLEALHAASGGRIDLLSHPQFAALGTFPVNAHMGGRWFLPFADNTGVGSVGRALGWRISERLKLPELQHLAWLECRAWDAQRQPDPLQPGGCGGTLQDVLRQLFWMPEQTTSTAPTISARTWLPSLDVLVVRTPGLVLGVKGGHNDENHNHNDVGTVVVLKNVRPVVIDVGVGSYEMRTFSNERYQIWNIRGSGHNPPVIAGHEQQVGRQHAAREVRAWREGDSECFTADLALCFAEAAGVRLARRTVRFDTVAQTIAISDEVEIAAEGEFDVVTNWYTTEDPQTAGFTLQFPGAVVTTVIVPLDDQVLRQSWQTERLWHVTATVRGSGRVTATCVIT